MATTTFLSTPNIRRYVFTQYSQSTVAAFSTQFNTDWGAAFGGTAPQLLATTAQPLQAILIVPGGPTLTVNGGLARTPTDGATTNLSTTVTSATALFNQSDVGATITGTGIPASTTIVSVQSATSATMSAAATATGSSLSIVITRVGGDWIGLNYGTWQVIPAFNMGRSVTDGVTNGTTTVTSATAAFNSNDVGAIVGCVDLPAGTTIASVTNATTIVASVAATGSGTARALTISRTNSLFTPDVV
jgi:hypothetical protein